jgi:hypothetical protein
MMIKSINQGYHEILWQIEDGNVTEGKYMLDRFY